MITDCVLAAALLTALPKSPTAKHLDFEDHLAADGPQTHVAWSTFGR